MVTDQKLAAVEISFFDHGNAPSAPVHGSPPEGFACFTKQIGPHGAGPKSGGFRPIADRFIRHWTLDGIQKGIGRDRQRGILV